MGNWRSALKRILLMLAITAAIGFLVGKITQALVLVLGVYTALNLFQLRRLYKWLEQDPSLRPADPPETFGIWGEIFDGIYRLQNQERKASAYLSNIIDKAQESSAALKMAVIMINRKGNLDWWNQASEDLLGLQYPKDKNQAVTNLIRDPDFADYFHQENYGEPLKIKSPVSNKILEFQIAVFGENERLMLARDITQLHRLELMRKDFVGNVSHELGTPITVIKGYLEAIVDNMADLDTKWQTPMRQMQQQAQRMENIVRDLLLLSSLETQTLSKQQEEFSLWEMFNEVENDARQMFADKAHQFSLSCERNLLVKAKRNEIYSAISNLLVNAAKYTPAKGNIALSARLSEQFLEIRVEDNGVGIEPEHIPRLTERFYRVDASRSKDTGGTGLGLAIVKHILSRHDGDLLIESEYGKGSCFTCRLPSSRANLESEIKNASHPEEYEAK